MVYKRLTSAKIQKNMKNEECSATKSRLGLKKSKKNEELLAQEGIL